MSRYSSYYCHNNLLLILHPLESVYIPVKDMMVNAPGFRSLYNLRNIHFEEVYADIIDKVFIGSLRSPTDSIIKNEWAAIVHIVVIIIYYM
jgi:hypothetical protein